MKLNQKAERIVSLASEVANLRSALEKKEHELNGLVGGDEQPRMEVAARSAQYAVPGVREGSYADKVLGVLTGAKTAMSAKDLAPLVGVSDPHVLRSTLNRLTKKHVLRKIGRGKYRLSLPKPEQGAM